ncbi:hypothetical protein BDQ12DRAFT_594008, partial [Crucibulum laeve]
YNRCEHRSTKAPAHLILRNLHEFNLEYLTALVNNDVEEIQHHEKFAKQGGFGPLAPCQFCASPSEQKQLCPHWHCSPTGKLHRGSLTLSSQCSVKFSIYQPYDLRVCPSIVIICFGEHSHAQPFPVKTPPSILALFNSMLLNLDWKVADATPRKIMTDSGFISDLQRHLHWSSLVDPSLSNLHPSLGNSDHVQRLIDILRQRFFPRGTGFDGAKLLVEEHQCLPIDEQYVCCAETHTIENGKTFQLVICMSREMASTLMNASNISLDTSFKQLHGKWQEFEMETWDLVNMKSFMTSQSAQAHLILFTRIFDFAHSETGIPIQFCHIHGARFNIWIADAHKGQALGVGLFCQWLCQNMFDFCSLEPWRRLQELTPYDHLHQFYCLCYVHFKRNIHDIRSTISVDVADAMLSLAVSKPHQNLEGAYALINKGGPKARAWLKDKLDGKFIIPAIYQPASLIPLHIWQASPSTTNGNEQSHRSVNCDGVNLTMQGGIMRGMQYDFRAMSSLSLCSSQGIYAHDQISSEFRHSQISVTRQSEYYSDLLGV